MISLRQQPTFANLDTTNEWVQVEDLGEGGYRVRQPFVVWIKRTGPGNFKAAFRDANIAISGVDRDDAYQALVAEILDTFDVLTKESTLIPHAVEQLRTLRKYIVRE